MPSPPHGTVGDSPQRWIRPGGESRNLPREAETGNRLWGVTALDEAAYGGWMSHSTQSTGHRLRHHRAMKNRTAPEAQTPPNNARRPIKGPFARWPRAADAVLAIIVFLWAVFDATEDLSMTSVLIAAVASGALYWRRSRPLVVLGVALAGSTLSLALGYPDGGLAAMFAVDSAGRYADNDRWSYIGVGGAVAVVMLGQFLDDKASGEVALAGFFMFVVWYLSRRVRFRAERAAQLEGNGGQKSAGLRPRSEPVSPESCMTLSPTG